MGSRLTGYTYRGSIGAPIEIEGDFTFDDDVFPEAVVYAQVNEIEFEIASHRGLIRAVSFGPRVTDYIDVPSVFDSTRRFMAYKTEGTATIVIVPGP